MTKNPPKKVLGPGGSPEHYQNAKICSLFHYQHFLKVLLKSNQNFSSYFAKSQMKQTKRQINAGKNITSVAEVIM